MKSYSVNEATRELGISRAKLLEMIRQREVKAEKTKSGYRIKASEMRRLAKKLEEEEAKLDKELDKPSGTRKDPEEKYYTVTQVSEKLGIERAEVMRWVKTGKIESTKGAGRRSPYLIPESQVQRLYEMNFSETTLKKQEMISTPKVEMVRAKDTYPVVGDYYRELVQIQKNISETQQQIALTQQQMAVTLAQLLKES